MAERYVSGNNGRVFHVTLGESPGKREKEERKNNP